MREGQNGESLFNGYRVSVWEDSFKVREMDGDGGYTTLGMCLMPLNCTHGNN